MSSLSGSRVSSAGGSTGKEESPIGCVALGLDAPLPTLSIPAAARGLRGAPACAGLAFLLPRLSRPPTRGFPNAPSRAPAAPQGLCQRQAAPRAAGGNGPGLRAAPRRVAALQTAAARPAGASGQRKSSLSLQELLIVWARYLVFPWRYLNMTKFTHTASYLLPTQTRCSHRGGPGLGAVGRVSQQASALRHGGSARDAVTERKSC